MMEVRSAPEWPWIDIAQKERLLGVFEKPGEQHEARILEYLKVAAPKGVGRWFYRDETPWCSAFACYCMEGAGIPSPKSAAARRWLRWGRECEAKPGAVCVLKRGLNPLQGHVGFVVGLTAAEVLLLGGNQGNRVSVKIYPRSRVLGFRWPAQ